MLINIVSYQEITWSLISFRIHHMFHPSQLIQPIIIEIPIISFYLRSRSQSISVA